MNTTELEALLSLDQKIERHFYHGVFALDQFVENTEVEKENRGVCIVNEQASEAAGTHWVLIYFDEKKVVFFDSFGRPPAYFKLKAKINKLSRRKKKTLEVSKQRLQSYQSVMCGGFVICFAFFLSRNYNLKTISRFFSKVDTAYNDTLIRRFMVKVFSFYFY